MSVELYRHFDKDGSLLYVGVSLATVKRLHAHRYGEGSWFKEITRIDIERFPTLKIALAAEKKAIQKEGPRHNNQHAVYDETTGKIPNPIARYMSRMGKKGGAASIKKQFSGLNAAERSEMMSKVRAAGVAKQKAAKDNGGG